MSRIGVKGSSSCILRFTTVCCVLLHFFVLTLAVEIIGEGSLRGNGSPSRSNKPVAKASLTIENAITIIYGGGKVSQAAAKKQSPGKAKPAPSQAPKSTKSTHNPQQSSSQGKHATSDASTFNSRFPPPQVSGKANRSRTSGSSGKKSTPRAGSSNESGTTIIYSDSTSYNKGSNGTDSLPVNTTQSQGASSSRGAGIGGNNFNVSQAQTTVNNSQTQGAFVTKAQAPLQVPAPQPATAKYFTQFATTSVCSSTGSERGRERDSQHVREREQKWEEREW